MVKTKNINDVLESVRDAPDQISFSDDPNLLDENYVTNENFTLEIPAPVIIQTLPNSFNSLIGESIDIDTDHAQELIGMLGRKLGIEDFRTNLAAFWLLDAMALEITRIGDKLSSMNRALLISWIAGETRLIQENQFTREEFFRKMDFIFTQGYEQLSKGQPLPYWEDIVQLESFLKKQSEPEEDPESKEAAFMTNLGHRHSSTLIMSQESDINPTNSMDVFEAIIESTYVMYANAFHYETVSAAFAKPVELRPYRLPYTLRLPRPVRIAVSSSASQSANNPARGKARLKKDKGKLKEAEQSKPEALAEILQFPPMNDEDAIAQRRRYILPLVESNEAPGILEQYSQPPSINLIPTSKVEKKVKRKA